MLFKVNKDTLDTIDGYLVPDGFSEAAEILVLDGETEVYRGPCGVHMQSVVNVGRHCSGMVGFHLDESLIPAMREMTDLKIKDLKSGFLIYRRYNDPGLVNERVFRLETQFVPQTALDRSLKKHFRYNLPNMELHGQETVSQIFHLDDYASLYASGRVMMKNFELFLQSDLRVLTQINNPYMDFTIRLLTICAAKNRDFWFINERDKLSLNLAIEYFSNVNLKDTDQIVYAIKKAPKKILEQFRSPVTKLMVCRSPDDKITHKSVSLALNMLSQFDQVFLANDEETTIKSLSEMLNIPDTDIRLDRQQDVFYHFSSIFESISALDSLLECDLILYHYLQEAIQKVDQSNEQLKNERG